MYMYQNHSESRTRIRLIRPTWRSFRIRPFHSCASPGGFEATAGRQQPKTGLAGKGWIEQCQETRVLIEVTEVVLGWPNVAWADQEVADRTCPTFWAQALEKEETKRQEAVCGAFDGNHALPGQHLASFTTCSWVLYRLDLCFVTEPSADIWASHFVQSRELLEHVGTTPFSRLRMKTSA